MRDRRRTARDDAEQIAFVNQVLLNLLEQLAHASRVLELHVQVVDEEQEDAAGGVDDAPDRRQDDAFGRRRRRRFEHVRDAAAMAHRHRRDLLLDAVFVDLELVLLQVRE